MKRITALILSLAMLFCAAYAAAEAETAKKVTLGTVSINGAFTLQCGIPEGYTPVPLDVAPQQVLAVFRSEDPDAPVMYLSVAFDEQYYDVDRMNDLSAEDRELLEQTYINDDPEVEITYGETGYGTELLIARHETEDLDYVAFFSIYKGYCVEFVLAPPMTAADKNLTEEQLKICVDFLTDLDFIPADMPVINARTVAGQRLQANLSEYDPETNTVKAEILRAVTLDPSVLTALQEGDTLTLGQESLPVETLEKDEYGTLINGYIELRQDGDQVLVFSYEQELMEIAGALKLNVPEGLVFLDHIDPATGEPLDEPTQHTAAEFIEMMDAGYPDFASQNVYVTFDDNGEMVQVDRIYTPWQ